MMRFTCLFVAGLLAFNVSDAQELKGPKAKHHKPWKEQKTGTLVVNDHEAAVKGPSFKNKKAWESRADKVEITPKVGNKEDITGPKGKNRKVWKKN